MGIACRKGQAFDRHTDRNVEFEPFDLHTLAQDREDAVGSGLQPLAFLARRPEIGRAGIERAALYLEDRKSNTSELQSLMRISYAVFCLKKKKKTDNKQHKEHYSYIYKRHNHHI